MKILVMGFAKVKFMPYANFYLENIGAKKNEVHFLYWNRDLKDEDLSDYKGITFHEFKCYQEDDVSKLSKIGSFLKYRAFAKKVIKQGGFDFLIGLHSLPAVLVYDVIKKRFKNKFVFDYRDSTYEGFPPFKKIISGLVKASSATFVSSNGFRRFLPESEKDKIFTSHNLLTDSLCHREEKRLRGTKSDKIRLAFWGFIRHEEINREIINKISKDDRFELHYYGREQQVALNLKQYAKVINANNVFFHGEYKPEDRYTFVRNTDLIHNLYYDNNMMLAMGNKYYDAAIFCLPIISFKGSVMGEAATKAGIGFVCNPYDEDFTNQIFDYYSKLNFEEFYKNCDNELDKILKEYNDGKDFLLDLFDKC